MKTKGNDFAQPCDEEITNENGNRKLIRKHKGLTKREYFVGMAMTNIQGAIGMEREMAQECVKLADAIIEELNKGVNTQS